MKTFILQLITAVLILIACKQNASTKTVQTASNTEQNVNSPINYKDGFKPASRLFPDKLRDLPNEINAAHYPNPCYATFEDSMFIWKHNTTIKTKEDLQIVEYGSFVYTEKGWHLRVTLSPKDFENYYNCKDGLLKKGILYTDNASWRRDTRLTAGDAMWYYIAKDKNGKLVKGTAPIETEGKLINSTTKNASVIKSNISWTGYGEIGGYSLTGNIKLKNYDIQMQGDTLKSAAITIDMTYISHEDKNVENHLKDKDFFDIKKFPVATFESLKIEYLSPSKATAIGNLTVKGVSKEIKIPLKIENKGGNKILTTKISVDRTKFGIKYNSKSFFGNLGDQAIKNKFDLAFNITLKL
ncbi:MAG: YceI family protein [Ferruginibacter sp.]|nr:YceI family protein [Ferruginibacter sp.]